jgi:hypothetical protein
MRYRDGKRGSAATGELGRTVLYACIIAMLLASSVAVASAVTALDISPKVGDILVFRPGAHVATDWSFDVARSAEPTSRCVLKPELMAAGGGSLVIEERLRHPYSYSVHWAGTRSSDGSFDCGRSADLIVTGPDMQLLSNAVGGPGLDHWSFGDL